MGSVAWVNAVRAANLFSRDPEDYERVFFMPMKMNVGKPAGGLVYQIVPHGECARVQWLGEVSLSADEAVNREKSKPRGVVAAEWLIERFREKQEWPSADLFKAGRDNNISKDAIYEAKRRLRLPDCRQEVDKNGTRFWVWWVPANWEPLQQTPP